jgi:hypothetical protein
VAGARWWEQWRLPAPRETDILRTAPLATNLRIFFFSVTLLKRLTPFHTQVGHTLKKASDCGRGPKSTNGCTTEVRPQV